MPQEETVAELRVQIAEGVRAAADRVHELRDELIAAGEKPLLRGEWRIRDALSHLAARSNSVALVHKRIADQDKEQVLTIDEVNHGQVDERRDDLVADLIDEIVSGSEAALTELDTLSDAFLEQTVKVNFGPGEMPASTIILFGGPRHFHQHIGDIEEALRA